MKKLKVYCVFFNFVGEKVSEMCKWNHKVWVLAYSQRNAYKNVVGYWKAVDCRVVDRNTMSADPGFAAVEGIVMM